MKIFKKAFNGKTVLISGHTGFKGSWLSLWLSMLGAKVIGISKEIPSQPSNFESIYNNLNLIDKRIDITDTNQVCDVMLQYQPDFVFHLAAQALVRPSYEFPLETIATNALGTTSILEGLRILKKPITAVMITSDKAYDNVEWVWGYRETDKLGGKDPYSASKGMAELAIRSYFESYFNRPDSDVRIGITRAGNVIGGGDWAVDRIVPDCINAWANKKNVDIRSPEATRPWQHVLEPLSGYLQLAQELSLSSGLSGEAYNFGPPGDNSFSVRELINEMSNHWDQVKWNDISNNKDYFHEAGLLKLNCDKALHDLDWKPTLSFKETVKMTVEWYKHYHKELDNKRDPLMYDFGVTQIEEYVEFAKNRDISWAK